MFTAADFKLIQRICLTDLFQLLTLLNIDHQKMSFTSGDEFEKYSDLDKEIDKKICAKLNSTSVLEGYTKLLDRGKIPFNLSETRIELLKKILSNREKIQSPNSTATKDFDCTFNIAERSTFNIRDLSEIKSFAKSLKSNFTLPDIPEKITLTARKKELYVSESAKSKIKKILREELRGMNIDEIAVSIISRPATGNNSVSKQVDKIFDKI